MRMPGGLRTVDHDERLSTVAHLDELRSRIILALITVAVAFAFCFWQNHRLLHLIDAPLDQQTQRQVRDGSGPLGATYRIQQSARDIAYDLRTVVGTMNASPQTAAQGGVLTQVRRHLAADVQELSAPPQGDRPVTLGVGEPFTTTVTVTLIFALILSFPVLMSQAYAYLLPAFPPDRRGALRSLTAAIPLLFICGVAFGYFVVLPAAIRFFQNFNSDQFNVLVQASPYYKFAATTLLAMGVVFEVPAAIIAATRAGITTTRQLRRSRRYAIGICALIAATLPGDAITMLLETVPLYLLYELSLIVAAIGERRAHARAATGSFAADGSKG